MNGVSRGVEILAGQATLGGDLRVPEHAVGLVLFAHGSGSSRHSPRNQHVATALQQANLATLLMDLLTADEEAEDQYTARLRFNIPLLSQRLVHATDWLARQSDLCHLPCGYFGASTGAAAALLAAAERPDVIRAVVSRGGRPDLAAPKLSFVRAATLLIVGGADPVVIGLNREAMRQLQSENQIEIIPGAGHLFEERGALDQVARLASQWFLGHFQLNR